MTYKYKKGWQVSNGKPLFCFTISSNKLEAYRGGLAKVVNETENINELISKFMDKVERLVLDVIETKNNKVTTFDKNEKELNYARHYTIKNVDRDISNFSFNTSIARLMEYVSALSKYNALSNDVKNVAFIKECVSDLILLLAPFAPHFSEELWSLMGNKKSIFTIFRLQRFLINIWNTWSCARCTMQNCPANLS